MNKINWLSNKKLEFEFELNETISDDASRGTLFDCDKSNIKDIYYYDGGIRTIVIYCLVIYCTHSTNPLLVHITSTHILHRFDTIIIT